ncbi:glutathione S-transferase [Finegoldia magna]|uniref:glutathione S-transferase family protein n=1 Tax=Finegoldia magna TaxID=1260 RepID=UPI000B9199D2|nr:glutathione S-transferase family protein [Finegoldia magna]MDU5808744.1 glutathione S-transferase family protein [Finegoldia magna]OXZ31941.1 glutathione S-transferase [Finegoldia magna]
MKLYYAPGTCAVACWIALEWAGADYEVEKVQLGTDEYRKINPLGAVPALDIGEGIVRSELAAILRYILNKYPEKDLGADESAEDKFQFDEIMAFMTGDFHPSFKGLFAAKSLTTSTDEKELENIKKASFAAIDSAMTNLDRLIGDGDYVYKNKKTVLDAYVYVLTRWSELTPKSWKEYPNIKRVSEKIEKDEVVQEIMKKSQE